MQDTEKWAGEYVIKGTYTSEVDIIFVFTFIYAFEFSLKLSKFFYFLFFLLTLLFLCIHPLFYYLLLLMMFLFILQRSSLLKTHEKEFWILFSYLYLTTLFHSQLAKEKEIYLIKLSEERMNDEQSFQDFKSMAIKRQVGSRSVDWCRQNVSAFSSLLFYI